MCLIEIIHGNINIALLSFFFSVKGENQQRVDPFLANNH